MMAEAKDAQEQIKIEQEKVARELLDGLVSLQDTLVLITEQSKDVGDEEKQALIYANESLMFFADSNNDFINARPRSIREEDRKKIFSGQHAGVFLQFNAKDATVLRINFWGGLRTVGTLDLQDSDKTMRHSHTIRTDRVITQKTHINWQISYPNGPTLDSWIVYNPDNQGIFSQSTLKVDGESVDCHPHLTVDDSRFDQIKSGVFGPIETFTKLVPSSV
jgi:hypothetical protein